MGQIQAGTSLQLQLYDVEHAAALAMNGYKGLSFLKTARAKEGRSLKKKTQR